MAELLLETRTVTAHLDKYGSTSMTLTSPAKLKVQTTGPGSETLFESGPESGKTWVVRVNVEIIET